MGVEILMIPADTIGNILWLKDYRQDEKLRHFVKYKSTYNDMPFIEVELSIIDMGQYQDAAIRGDDGTVLYRFNVEWIKKLI